MKKTYCLLVSATLLAFLLLLCLRKRPVNNNKVYNAGIADEAVERLENSGQEERIGQGADASDGRQEERPPPSVLDATNALEKVEREMKRLDQKMTALTEEYHRYLSGKYAGWTREQAERRIEKLSGQAQSPASASAPEAGRKECRELNDFLLLTVEVPEDPDVVFLGNDIVPVPDTEEYREVSKRFYELRDTRDMMRMQGKP
ncbi:MAG: hypothetical protein FWG50_07565 [Kiritimatiellaeota bacterium]|nr:hypothetical protein [Kiritimatiellota bacterium]